MTIALDQHLLLAFCVALGAALYSSGGAARLLCPKLLRSSIPGKDPPISLAVLVGAVICLLSGLTGTGGGIVLAATPVFGWSDTKMASGSASVFILCNSVAGLLGNLASLRSLPAYMPLFAGAVLLGALIGTGLGVKLAGHTILKAPGLVLLIAV